MVGYALTIGRIRYFIAMVVAAVKDWIRDRCDNMAAAMAFNAMLGAAPFVAMTLWIARRIFGEELFSAYIIPTETAWVGTHGNEVLLFLSDATENVDATTFLTLGVLGVISFLLGASGYFLAFQDALEVIWNVRREQARIKVQLRKRLFGLLYALASSVLMLAGLTLGGLVLAQGSRTDSPILRGVSHATEALIAFLTFWIVITFLLKNLPPVELKWRQVIPWAASISGLHLIGRVLLTGLIGTSDGSLAASFLLVILWFYYDSLIILYGAELMHVFLIRSRGASDATVSE